MPHGSIALPTSLCPLCGAVTKLATGVHSVPRRQDWFLCVNCAGILWIGEDLRPVAPPPGAYDDLLRTNPFRWFVIYRLRDAILNGRIREGSTTPPQTGSA
jgi:hypothetical protein